MATRQTNFVHLQQQGATITAWLAQGCWEAVDSAAEINELISTFARLLDRFGGRHFWMLLARGE